MSKDKKLFKKYDSFCSICGLPIMVHQIGICLDDLVLMDFNDRCYVDLSAHICSECWEKIKANTQTGMEGAVRKLKDLKKLQKAEL